MGNSISWTTYPLIHPKQLDMDQFQHAFLVHVVIEISPYKSNFVSSCLLTLLEKNTSIDPGPTDTFCCDLKLIIGLIRTTIPHLKFSSCLALEVVCPVISLFIFLGFGETKKGGRQLSGGPKEKGLSVVPARLKLFSLDVCSKESDGKIGEKNKMDRKAGPELCSPFQTPENLHTMKNPLLPSMCRQDDWSFVFRFTSFLIHLEAEVPNLKPYFFFSLLFRSPPLTGASQWRFSSLLKLNHHLRWLLFPHYKHRAHPYWMSRAARSSMKRHRMPQGCDIQCATTCLNWFILLYTQQHRNRRSVPQIALIYSVAVLFQTKRFLSIYGDAIS